MYKKIKQILSINEQNIYERLFTYSIHSTPFHNINFLYALEKSYKNIELHFYILYHQDEIISIMPFFKRKYLFFTLNSLPNSCYGGFLYEQIHQKHIQDFLQTTNFMPLLSIIHSYDDPIYKHIINAVPLKHSTWVIDTHREYQEIFNDLHPKTRNQIKKSNQYNILIRNIFDNNEVKAILSLYNQLIQKHNIRKPYPADFFYLLFHKTKIDPNIIIKVAEYDNKIIAYSVFLKNKYQLFYWLNASDPAYSKMNATNKILNHMLKFAAEDEYINELNLGAIPEGNYGLSHYKHRWNAVKKEYFSYVSPLLHFIKNIR